MNLKNKIILLSIISSLMNCGITNAQNIITYGEGISFLKINETDIVCRTPDQEYNFKILNSKDNFLEVYPLNQETGEIDKTNKHKIKIFGETDSIQLISSKVNSVVYTFFSQKLNPFKTKNFIYSFEYQIQDLYNDKNLKLEVNLDGQSRISNFNLTTLDTFKLKKDDLDILKAMIQSINIGTLNTCKSSIYDASHMGYYSFTFTDYNLKKHNISYQFTPYLLKDFEIFVESILTKRGTIINK